MTSRTFSLLILCSCVAVAGAVVSAAPDNPAAVARAQAHARQNAAATFFGPDQALVATDVITDADGTEHVRFARTYRGLRVVGGDLVVHGSGDGAFLGVSQTLSSPLNLSTTAALPSQGAVRRGLAEFAGQPASSKAELIVFARDVPTLAYEVVIGGQKNDQSPSELHVVVDATTAAVLDSWDGIETADASGTGNGFFSGIVSPFHTNSASGGYQMKDLTRGGQYTVDMKNKQGGSGSLFTDADNVWGDGTLSNRQSVGVDAQYGTAETWDYYKLIHGRNGIGDDGKGSYNRVHYGRNYNNAFWSDSCFCMTYGDGDGRTFNPFDSLDVAGHEMSHGVTSRTAGLIYSGESGGLNEGNSDIFGTMVEYYANNPNDPPDYYIGERLFKASGYALRSMPHPSLDGASADCWYSTVGSLDVHYSSGVANHFYYLLAEGTSGPWFSPTCNPADTRVASATGSVAGIGRTKAQKIWYRALTVYFTANTNYAAARTGTLSAAADLFGAGSPEQNAVAAAWSAVNVN